MSHSVSEVTEGFDTVGEVIEEILTKSLTVEDGRVIAEDAVAAVRNFVIKHADEEICEKELANLASLLQYGRLI